MRVSLWSRSCKTLPVILLAAALGTPTVAQLRPDLTIVAAPEPTDLGVWDGTWFHVNRDGRMALWARTRNGKTEMKLQFQSKTSPETFETEWNGRADYELAGFPAVFEMKIDQQDANRMEGAWNWEIKFRVSERSEKGDFTLYRANDGRTLVLLFEDFTRVVRRGEKVNRFEGSPSWSFRKASKRLILWDEIPF